jgi:hypothetical protein
MTTFAYRVKRCRSSPCLLLSLLKMSTTNRLCYEQCYEQSVRYPLISKCIRRREHTKPCMKRRWCITFYCALSVEWCFFLAAAAVKNGTRGHFHSKKWLLAITPAEHHSTDYFSGIERWRHIEYIIACISNGVHFVCFVTLVTGKTTIISCYDLRPELFPSRSSFAAFRFILQLGLAGWRIFCP